MRSSSARRDYGALLESFKIKPTPSNAAFAASDLSTGSRRASWLLAAALSWPRVMSNKRTGRCRSIHRTVFFSA